MPRVITSIHFESFHEETPAVDLKGPELEKAVDEDIGLFEEFFRGLGNDPLSKPERAILKTYLAYKTGAHASQQEETQGAQDAS